MLFESIDYTKIAVRDNGDLKCKKGDTITKKFKYINSSDGDLTLDIISNAPAVLSIKTPLLVVA
jgi:hypothetical protein